MAVPNETGAIENLYCKLKPNLLFKTHALFFIITFFKFFIQTNKVAHLPISADFGFKQKV